MDIKQQGGTLNINGIRELTFASAASFRKVIDAVGTTPLSAIEVDLSQVDFLDSAGLGALASFYNLARSRIGRDALTIRLLNPQPAVQQVIELTRMHHLFEVVVPRAGESSDA